MAHQSSADPFFSLAGDRVDAIFCILSSILVSSLPSLSNLPRLSFGPAQENWLFMPVVVNPGHTKCWPESGEEQVPLITQPTCSLQM